MQSGEILLLIPLTNNYKCMYSLNTLFQIRIFLIWFPHAFAKTLRTLITVTNHSKCLIICNLFTSAGWMICQYRLRGLVGCSEYNILVEGWIIHKWRLWCIYSHNHMYILTDGGVTGFLGSLKSSPCEERRLKDTLNLICEDRRFQNCLYLKTEDLASKPEDWRFEFLTGKTCLLSVINWEDRSWWYLPHWYWYCL